MHLAVCGRESHAVARGERVAVENSALHLFLRADDGAKRRAARDQKYKTEDRRSGGETAAVCASHGYPLLSGDENRRPVPVPRISLAPLAGLCRLARASSVARHRRASYRARRGKQMHQFRWLSLLGAIALCSGAFAA